jgi:hypothetical protein
LPAKDLDETLSLQDSNRQNISERLTQNNPLNACSAETLQKLIEDFGKITVQHTATEAAASAFWNFAVVNCDIICQIKKKSQSLPSYKTVKRHNESLSPKVLLTIAYKDKLTGSVVIEKNLEEFPKSKFSKNSQFKLLYELTFV